MPPSQPNLILTVMQAGLAGLLNLSLICHGNKISSNYPEWLTLTGWNPNHLLCSHSKDVNVRLWSDISSVSDIHLITIAVVILYLCRKKKSWEFEPEEKRSKRSSSFFIVPFSYVSAPWFDKFTSWCVSIKFCKKILLWNLNCQE